MAKTKVILICVIQFLFNILTTEALQCLSCNHVAEARDCSHLETCGANAECFVQRFIGSNLKQYYKMGCKASRICATDSNSLLTSAIGKKRDQTDVTSHWYNKRSDTDLLLCLQCCNNVDGCNKDLCGSAPTTLRRCLNCDDVLGWKDCQDIAECSTDELCYVQATPLSINYEIRVKMGCMGHLQCEGIKKAFPQRCVVCCNDADFCNYNACDNYTSNVPTKLTSPPTPSTHPTTTTTTAAATTTTTTIATPTKPEFDIHVDGPPSSVTYGTKTSLTCITAPPALSYKWTFKNGQPLPSGVSGSYLGTTSGGYAGISVLTVPSVDKTTAGSYSCTATFSGVLTHSSSFDLKASPVQPTVNLEKGPVSKNFVLICETTGYPSPSVTWNFNGDAGQTILPPGIDVANNGTTYTLFVYTYDQAKYNGLWSCTAVNAGGVATSAVRVP